MKILITGATGSVGKFLIEELSSAKHTILALTRNAEKYESNEVITYVTGNLNDVNTFVDILKEVDCIFLLLTSECDPNIISAASNAGVKKIVGLSNGTKYLVEEHLKNYSQEWTILYPVEFPFKRITVLARLYSSWSNGKIPIPGSAICTNP